MDYLAEEQTHVGALSDESDRASFIESIFNDDALRNERRKFRPETHPRFDGTHCIDCGEEIPKERLTLGRIRCVECQALLEHRRKLRLPQ